MSQTRSCGLLIALILSLSVCTSAIRAQQEQIEILNLPGSEPGKSSTGNNASSTPHVSSDGRFVAFTSRAVNLVANDENGAIMDVFVHDRETSETFLVSQGTENAPANGLSHSPQVSSDGRRVLFISNADNLVENDTNRCPDVFLHDRDTGTTSRVSENHADGTSANAPSSEASMTPDGRFVVFTSRADNLVAADDNNWPDVFLYDVQAGSLQLISISPSGAASEGGRSWGPRISADGETVVFLSNATNLVETGTEGSDNLFVRDLASGTTRQIRTIWTEDLEAYSRIFNPVLSSDGRYLAFQGIATTTAPSVGGIAWYDLENENLVFAAPELETENESGLPDLSGPVMSDDGKTLAFEAREESLRKAVYVWNADTRETFLGSQLEASESEPSGYQPTLSPDGRYLAFLRNPTNELWQLYVRNLSTDNAALLGGTVHAAASFSDNGEMLAFQSMDPDLVSDDNNESSDVFVAEPPTGPLQLISHSAPDISSRTPSSFSFTSRQALSADGRFAVFESYSDGLMKSDTNGFPDVFLKDNQRGELSLISESMTGNRSANGYSGQPVISQNGLYVAFASSASDLVEGDANGKTDVFLKQANTGETIRISPDQETASNLVAYGSLSISAQGERLAFQMTTGTENNVFLHDQQTGMTRQISVNSPGFPSLENNSHDPVISPDGGHVAFQSDNGTTLLLYDVANEEIEIMSEQVASRGAFGWSPSGRHLVFKSDTNIHVFDVETGESQQINTPLTPQNSGTEHFFDPAIAADGSRIAYVNPFETTYEGPVMDTNEVADVYLWELDTGEYGPVSVNHEGTHTGNARSDSPSLSADGRFLLFRSHADNLVEDGQSVPGIFLRDLEEGTTVQLNHDAFGSMVAERFATAPVLSPDGSTVLYQSWGDFVGAHDWNSSGDVFVYKMAPRPAVDSDSDSMDDNWELAHFGSLDRTGDDDFDSDGMSDRQEYLAGSNPANPFSRFTGEIIEPSSGGNLEITWAAQPDRQYSIEYTNQLTPPDWQPLDAPIDISNGTARASVQEFDTSAHRYYRVLVQQQ